MWFGGGPGGRQDFALYFPLPTLFMFVFSISEVFCGKVDLCAFSSWGCWSVWGREDGSGGRREGVRGKLGVLVGSVGMAVVGGGGER